MAKSRLKCVNCKGFFPAETMRKAPVGNFCTPNCMTAYAINKSNRERLKATADKVRRAETRKAKEKLKTRSDWLKEAQIAFNRYVRLRDKGKECISCGGRSEQRYGGTMEAGHYRSVGSSPENRFNLWSVHLQCVKCNRYLSGNAIEYRIRLIQRIGLDKVEAIEANNTPRHYSIEYLQRVKRIFNKKANRLSKRLESTCV